MVFIITLFGLAILAGLSLVFMGVCYHRSSLTLGLGHGGIALTAVVLLIINIVQSATTHRLYNDAALLFILTLGGGLVLMMTRGNNKSAPMPVVIIHASLALLALALLINGYIHG
jgi:hypothetical protein